MREEMCIIGNCKYDNTFWLTVGIRHFGRYYRNTYIGRGTYGGLGGDRRCLHLQSLGIRLSPRSILFGIKPLFVRSGFHKLIVI
jgi:hypothetical protein